MIERHLEDEQLGSSLRAMLSGAVAQGAVAMAKATEGSPEHDHWAEVASRAVPYALERFDEARAIRGEDTDSEVVVEIQPVDDGKQAKLARLAELEAEASKLRQELDS